MQLGSRPLVFKEITNVLGVWPIKRYGHSSTFIRGSNYLAIYGGRNDQLYSTLGESVIGSVSLLDLKYMVWCGVNTDISLTQKRYNHCASYRGNFTIIQLGSKLIVFGGVNSSSYQPGIL